MIKRIINKIEYLIHRNRVPSLTSIKGKNNFKLTHISAFSYGNAGDTILPVVLRDLFQEKIGVRKWLSILVHTVIDKNKVSKINKTDGLVIGGGGLFLKDTNPNNLSGWQWSCGIEELKEIKVPLVMFAVGYNRFRGQSDFEPIFTEHVNLFVRKAVFVGIRNTGSINKIKTYLADDIKDKLVYQPCMTTVISKLYPNYTNFFKKEDFIALNCAFDRQDLRSSDEEILNSIARVCKKLSEITKIKYYSHMQGDNKVLPYLDKHGVEYELIQFKTVDQIIKEYSRPKLVMGMRGHAQMIPFGCNTPILSIVSHDKLQWFIDDINHSEWGVDVLDPNFEENLLSKATAMYNTSDSLVKEVTIQQERLWQITLDNLQTIQKNLKAN